MKMRTYLEQLAKIVIPVKENDEGFKEWSEQSLFFEFLTEQRDETSIVLYASSFDHGSLLLKTILVPIADLERASPDALTRWDDPLESWSCGLVYGGRQAARVEYSTPLSRIQPEAFKHGERLVFPRSFDGRKEDKEYYEIAQSLSHAHGLHWTPERQAWCRLDDNGDVEEVIRLSEQKGRSGYGSATCISIDRTVLEMHMAATGMALVQMFDLTSIGHGFMGWNVREEKSVQSPEPDLYFRSHREGGNGSWVRGVQIVRPALDAQGFGQYLFEQERAPKQYASFITQDWKNKRIAEVSCAPDAMASYFKPDSPLPFEVSPVFFNGGVLDKYKADPEKYLLKHRSLTCRNAWNLQTYDVNDYGQVHTYLVYLSRLPYSEQLYWKSFNEAPKGTISDRAFTTDFRGEWSDHEDPLQDLQTCISQMHEAGVPWFTLRESALIDQLHYPLTPSDKGWSDTLIALAKLVVEGLERKYFEALAKQHGAAGDPKWGSIRWLQEAMTVTGVVDEVATEVLTPLKTLQNLRTKLSAHSGGSEAAALRAELTRKHSTSRAHIGHLSGELLRSLKLLRSFHWS